MELSEAIRLGAMMKPQAFRALFTDDGACAFGAALLAVGATRGQGLRFARHRWPWAFMVSANCPSCGRSWPVFGVITHLNDDHRWTREHIATWVAEIEPTEAHAVAEVPEAAGGAAWPSLPRSRSCQPRCPFLACFPDLLLVGGPPSMQPY